ncbi:fructose bisphosphate aldolase [Sphingomonas morindae]|uniref:fructose-bisphosphate aldolase n=1 Tax=Sphingomonas morindae TaxID=1541170 RepID=A0ABY4X916_9SPHN|nr:fructose bisphosphate aldolase [Sphingomonas morindae]USI73404.1 fructose bisphosphate aldolase [Sphingomonas morindae]
MADASMMARIKDGDGFIAALDQSGGSTPGALKAYGVPESAYHSEEEMFALIHEMRVRIITAPAFTGARLVGAILFERTMDGEAEGQKVPAYLWQQRQIVPFLKVDQGLAAEADGVRLMKPIAGLDALLDRAVGLGVFGTKMRSVVNLPSASGIAAIVDQQFEIGAQISAKGLVPILEPEVLITSPDKAGAEALLRDAIAARLDALPADAPVMLKLTIPETPDFYKPLIDHPKVVKVVALSGGYSRAEACAKLAHNHGMIASFSRALINDLRHDQSDAAFDATLAAAIEEIYQASTVKA